MAIDYQELLQKAYLTPEQLASPLTKRDPIQTERTTFGQYGIYNDAPILDAAKAEALTQQEKCLLTFPIAEATTQKTWDGQVILLLEN
jgi:hypothetical protein